MGSTLGCADNEGRVEIILELMHAKENANDNNEVIGIRHLADAFAMDEGGSGSNCYSFPVGVSDPEWSFQSLDQWSRISGEEQTSSCLTNSDPTCQMNGQPWCPLNQGVCYQRLQLTSKCIPLNNDGSTFTLPRQDCSTDSAGAFVFQQNIQVCSSHEAWAQDNLNGGCTRYPEPDVIHVIADNLQVFPAAASSTEIFLTIPYDLHLFRFTFNNDFDNDKITVSGDQINNEYNGENGSFNIPKFTKYEHLTIATKPRFDNYDNVYPTVLTDLWICRATVESILAYSSSFASDQSQFQSRDFCHGLTANEQHRMPILSANKPTYICEDDACIQPQHLPKDLGNVIDDGSIVNTNFALCDGDISCDALAIDMEHIIRRLGRTGKDEAYIIEAATYVGVLPKHNRRRALLDDDEPDYQTRSIQLFQIVESKDARPDAATIEMSESDTNVLVRVDNNPYAYNATVNIDSYKDENLPFFAVAANYKFGKSFCPSNVQGYSEFETVCARMSDITNNTAIDFFDNETQIQYEVVVRENDRLIHYSACLVKQQIDWNMTENEHGYLSGRANSTDDKVSCRSIETQVDSSSTPMEIFDTYYLHDDHQDFIFKLTGELDDIELIEDFWWLPLILLALNIFLLVVYILIHEKKGRESEPSGEITRSKSYIPLKKIII